MLYIMIHPLATFLPYTKIRIGEDLDHSWVQESYYNGRVILKQKYFFIRNAEKERVTQKLAGKPSEQLQK